MPRPSLLPWARPDHRQEVAHGPFLCRSRLPRLSAGPRRSLAFVIVLAVAAGARRARACVADAECDDGVACSLIDTCRARRVCVPGVAATPTATSSATPTTTVPALANAGQSDLDGDDDGDAPRRRRRRPQRGDRARASQHQRPRGRTARSSRKATSPPRAGGPLTVTGGFIVRVEDQGRSRRDRSRFTRRRMPHERQEPHQVQERRQHAADHLAAGLRDESAGLPVQRQVSRSSALAGPFFMPVRVTITNGPATLEQGIDRVGSIIDCRQTTLGMNCKE